MLAGLFMRMCQPNKVWYGRNSLARLRALGQHKFLVVTSPSQQACGNADLAVGELRKNGAEVNMYIMPHGEADMQATRAITAALDSSSPEAVVALGGGAVIDAAKMARALRENPDFNPVPNKMLEFPMTSARTKLVAIPTTAGSGAEVSVASVINDPATRRKLIFLCEDWLPDTAILDGRLLDSQPVDICGRSGLDVLAHGVEAYVSLRADLFHRMLAAATVRETLRLLPKALEGDRAARQNMMLLAYLAGLVQSNCSTGLAHALAHAAGSVWGLRHGTATGILVTAVIRFNATKCQAIYNQLACETGFDSINELCAAIEHLRCAAGYPSTLRQGLGSSPAEVDSVASIASQDPSLKTNPCKLDLSDIEHVLREVL